MPPVRSDSATDAAIVIDVTRSESMWLDPSSGQSAHSLDVDAGVSLAPSTLPVYRTGQAELPAVAAELVGAIGEVFGLSGPVEEVAAGGDAAFAGSFRLIDEVSGVELVLFELGSGMPYFVLEGENGGPLPIEAPADLGGAMTELLAVVGLSDDAAVTDVSEDGGTFVEYGLRASFRPPPYEASPAGLGLQGGAEWVLAVDGSGALLGAAGPAVPPVAVGQVATVGLDEALRRLSVMFAAESFGPVLTVAPSTTQLPLAEPSPPMETTTLVAGPSTQSTTTQTTPVMSTPVVMSAPPVAPTPVVTSPPLDAISSTTAPAPPGPPPPPSTESVVTVPPVVLEVSVRSTRIVDVRTELRVYFGSLEQSLLLPHHVFVADDGAEYPVLAVAPQHLRFDTGQPTLTTIAMPPPDQIGPPSTKMLGTVPIPQPMPTLLTDDGTPVTIPVPPGLGPVPGSGFAYYDDVLNAVLVGRPLGEAVATLEGSGWMVRVIDEDQPNVTLTADLRQNRANVGHRGGIVTGIVVDRGESVPAGSGTSTTTTSITTGTTSTIDTTTTTATSLPAEVIEALASQIPSPSDVGEPPADLDAWLEDETLAASELADGLTTLVRGLPADAVVDAFASAGWVVRAVDLDDPESLEEDLRFDRVNIFCRMGTVEYVEIS